MNSPLALTASLSEGTFPGGGKTGGGLGSFGGTEKKLYPLEVTVTVIPIRSYCYSTTTKHWPIRSQ